MRPIQSRLLAATAVVVVATFTLGACAQAEEASAPLLPETAPSETASPAPTPSPTGESEPATTGTATPPQSAQPAAVEAAPAEMVDFETQNGTLQLQVPSNWTVEDTSTIAMQGSGRQGWNNEVVFSPPTGGSLQYSDGYWGDTGPATIETRIVERIAIDRGLFAAAWWDRHEGGRYSVSVSIVGDVSEPFHMFHVGEGKRLHGMGFFHPDAQDGFDSRDAAEAYIGGPEVALALDVMASAAFTGEDDALPAGVGVEHDGTTYLPYTTQNGTASFLVPQHWSIGDHSRPGTNRAGQDVWDNSVALYLPNGNMVLHYGDMWITNLIEEWEWTLGEVRPTQTDGWQAVSWTLGDSVPNHAGYVGVSLSDQGGAVRPADNVCSENLCRSFSGVPLDVRWLDDGLESTEDFFGSAIEEQMLTAVASLETHHDDATRMPW
ncbi:hypothetical protein ACVWW9_000806 [Agrococcus sp. UYP33]